MTQDKKALVAEAREWRERALPPTPWGDKHIVNRLADALEAAESAPAVDREALATVLAAGSALDGASDETVGQFGGRLADALLASGLLRDVRDVQAEALERAADHIDTFERGDHSYITDDLRARAQAIREARND